MTVVVDGDAATGWKPGKAAVFLATPAPELIPQFSPDGRWIAYFAAEAGGKLQVYVRPFPGPGSPRRISTDVGTYPRWSATSNELLFDDYSPNKIMVVPYAVVGESFQAGKPQLWSPNRFVRRVSIGPTIFTPMESGWHCSPQERGPMLSTIRSCCSSTSSTS